MNWNENRKMDAKCSQLVNNCRAKTMSTTMTRNVIWIHISRSTFIVWSEVQTKVFSFFEWNVKWKRGTSIKFLSAVYKIWRVFFLCWRFCSLSYVYRKRLRHSCVNCENLEYKVRIHRFYSLSFSFVCLFHLK